MQPNPWVELAYQARLLQMATYLFVIGEFGYSKAQKSKVKIVAKDVVKSKV